MPKIHVNDIDLYYEDHGDPAAPAILLIMGLGTQMIAWPPSVIDGLTTAGFRVIAYDNRDVGLSTHLHGAPAVNPLLAMAAARFGLPFPLAYSLADMAADATALLDALGIDAAHVVGASMGGMIAQNLAIRFPGRVLSLTSIMSSSGAAGLPGPSRELRERLFARRPANPSREQAIAAGAEAQKALSYPDPARAPDAFASMAAQAFDRASNPTGFRRQLLAILADRDRARRLAEIRVPTLVVHGRADPLVPLACGTDVARRVPGAKLEIVDAMGHDLPPSQIAHVTALIVDHARGATAG